MSVTSNTLSRRQAGQGYSCLRKELHSAYRPDRIILPGEGTTLVRSAHCRCSVRAEDPQALTVILCVKRGLGGRFPRGAGEMSRSDKRGRPRAASLNSRAIRAELPLFPGKRSYIANFQKSHVSTARNDNHRAEAAAGSGDESPDGCRVVNPAAGTEAHSPQKGPAGSPVGRGGGADYRFI